MAGERVLPGLGLTGFWNPGSGNWGQAHSEDIRTLSILTQCIVQSRTETLDVNAPDGFVAIAPPSNGNADQIFFKDDGTEYFISPPEGCIVYVLDESAHLIFSGGSWKPLSDKFKAERFEYFSTALTLNPMHSGKTIRMMNNAASTVTVPDNVDTPLPIDSFFQVRRVGSGSLTIVPGSGVTLRSRASLVFNGQYSHVNFHKVDTDIWEVYGDLAP